MKKLVFCALAALVFAGCRNVPENIVLTFDVTGPVAGEVVVVCNMDMKTFPLDSDGHAAAVFDDVDAAYARVIYGQNERKIYIERGDRAAISFDARDFDGTFRFEGPKSQAVGYLHDVTLLPLPDEDYSLPFEEYVSKLKAKENDALKLLKANDIKGAGRFVEMEKGRIRYSYATPLLMYPVGHMMMTRNTEYRPGDDYYRKIEEYFVEDSELICLDEYRNFIIEAAHVLDADNRQVTALKPKTVAQMRFISDRFGNRGVVQNLLHYLASSYVDTFGIDDIDEMESLYRTYVKDSLLLADYAVKYDKWDRSKPGKPSPDFEAVDIDGKKWSLSDFRGRYVYIDMWATWCAPCKRELPYLKALAEKFSDAHIVFLGLSVDGQKENWEKMVKSGQMCGTQLYIGPRSTFQQAYNIKGIPRFILLDKEGCIISNDMSRPSSDETFIVLESLEGIR